MRLPLIALLFVASVVALSAQPRQDIQLTSQLQTAKHDSTRLKIYLNQAQLHLLANQSDSLYRSIQRGFQIWRKWPSHYYGCELYYYLGRYYRLVSQHPKGVQPMRLALYHAQKANRIDKVIDYQYRLAVFLSDANDLSGALKQIYQNINYLQRHPNEPMLAANYMFIVEFSQSLNNPALAEFYTAKYLSLIKPSWPLDHQIFAQYVKGELLEKKGQFKAAEYHYRLALRYARQQSDQLEVLESLMTLASNLRKQERYQAAIPLLREARIMARTIQSTPHMASSEIELATIYLASRQLDKALITARSAVKLGQLNNTIGAQINALNCLVNVLEANGQYREALQHYRELQELKEKRFTENNAQQITQMQAKFEAEKKDKTIKLLQKNEQINRLNAARQQQQIAIDQQTKMAETLVIGLFMLLTGVIYYSLRKSRRDFSVLTQQQQLLQQTTTALSDSNTLKDKLFSLISHDLRSPLASIKTNIWQIMDNHQRIERLPSLLTRLDKQVDSVLDLLTNLLDWSMIQLKGFQPQMQLIQLQNVIEDVSSQASEPIRQKDLLLINHVDPSAMVMADKYQLQAIVRNLIGNAIKFTPVGGYIRLVSIKQDDFVELQIRDSGIGMTDEQLASLFSSPEVRRGTMGESGTGLGLRICREMLERQGGSLYVESQPGNGSCVRILLAVGQEAFQLSPVL